MKGYSPRTWGWTEWTHDACAPKVVFPTHVGMDRLVLPHHGRRFSIPHARGDGPESVLALVKAFAYSPRTWGWTAIREVPVLLDRRIPHARGDGPWNYVGRAEFPPYSPRTWGWTDPWGMPLRAGGVFPTHVGMDRV